MFSRVAIIGLGLIGGSVASGLRQRGLAAHVTAWDKQEAALKEGAKRGVIDSASASIADAIADADLVILAVPMLAVQETFVAMRDVLGDDTIVTDVGSVKCAVFEAARQAFGEIPQNLVPGHPIAGSERHGVGAADPDVFAGHKVILTPKLSTNGDATRAVREMWQALDAMVVEMDPEHHDLVLAQTSHLPHLLAYALVDTLSHQGDSLEIFEYAAGGFRDFTRIAASDPVMWRDIFAANSGPVLEILDRFTDDLARLRTLVSEGRTDELTEVFARAKTARDHFSLLMAQRKPKGEH
ncbi:MAG TPA: prephenate dehydrogenase/arogenate dehydrogenase family protein [Pseudomonadales bacterium]|nr:prephenate dehydrogenase/arogenate dehydrogenase family protein [Pseudomonadales bacterium]